MRLAVVLIAGSVVATGCGLLGGSDEDLSPEALARAACGQWFQYARPEPGRSAAPELLPLADSDAHDAAEGSTDYAELEAALHAAVHSLVPTGTATAAPAQQPASATVLLQRANRACDQLPS